MSSVEYINGSHMLYRTNPKPAGLLMLASDMLIVDLVVEREIELDDELIGYTK